MGKSNPLDQSIAVFGEDGSGKTVMVSSFFGVASEPNHESLFRVSAETGQAVHLRQIFLGMNEKAQLPLPNKFKAATYSFDVKLKQSNGAVGHGKDVNAYDAFNLAWHDYPGDWFTNQVSGQLEEDRRVSTFRNLLSSNIALFLVDGQKLIDFKGSEEKYLKSLIGNFRDGLLSLKSEILTDGKKLKEFPRIWFFGLTKADLHPHMNVVQFRDLLVREIGSDIEDLRQVIGEFVTNPEYVSLGGDFVLLSSAKFSNSKIEFTKRIGIDLILPIAALVPMQRFLRWAKAKRNALDVGLKMKPILVLLLEVLPFVGALKKIGVPVKLLGFLAAIKPILDNASFLDEAGPRADDFLGKKHSEAVARHDYLSATFIDFESQLLKGVEDKVLLLSDR